MISEAQPQLDKAGITLLDPSEATDTNAFFVTKKYSDDNNVTTLSDLKGKSVVLAAAPDCEGRLDCEGGLEDDVRHQDHQDPAARLRQPADLQLGQDRRVPARRDLDDRPHAPTRTS